MFMSTIYSRICGYFGIFYRSSRVDLIFCSPNVHLVDLRLKLIKRLTSVCDEACVRCRPQETLSKEQPPSIGSAVIAEFFTAPGTQSCGPHIHKVPFLSRIAIS